MSKNTKTNTCAICLESLTITKTTDNFISFEIPGIGQTHASCYRTMETLRAERKLEENKRLVLEARERLAELITV